MKVKKHIVAYAVILAACYAFMPFVVQAAYNDRGYFAIGGEWFFPELIIIALEMMRFSLTPAKKGTKHNEYYGGTENGKHNEKHTVKR